MLNEIGNSFINSDFLINISQVALDGVKTFPIFGCKFGLVRNYWKKL